MDGRGSVLGRGKRFFSSPRRPEQISYPMGTVVPSKEEKRPGRELTTNLHLVPRSRMVELYFHFPIRLHGVVLNKLSTDTNFLFTFT
jgi:hypothetical protein